MSDKYSEAMASIRHYSNLRFAILTVFVAITGALVKHATSSECRIASTLCEMDTIRVIGIWVAVAFLIFEVALNYYVWGYSIMAKKAEKSTWQRHWVVARLVEIASISLPLGVLYLWVFVFNR